MSAELLSLVEQYRTGLEAELVLLVQLQNNATRQHQATQVADIDALQLAVDQRAVLTSRLMAIEEQIRPIHDRLTREGTATDHLPEFSHAFGLHQAAARMVKDILNTDHDSICSLEQIVAARRTAAQAAEQAETTLAAYARMFAPPPTATLVNSRG